MKWGMGFKPVKCNKIHLTRRQAETINAGYSLEDAVLQIANKIIYLGEIVTEDLKWNTHVGTTVKPV